MSRDTLQPGLANKLLLAGLLSCFRGKQKNIKVSQVIERKYTSAESLSRMYLSRLLSTKTIRINIMTDVEILLVDPWRIDQSIEIEIPDIHRSNYGRHVLNLIVEIKEELKTDLSSLDTLIQILQELLAAECVEYAEFYCKKEHIELEIYQPDNARLLLLLQDMSQGQVFMLIWRAVKNIGKSMKDSTSRTVYFEDIVELACEYSIQYGQLDITVEHYNRPKLFKPSRLTKMLLHDILEVTSDHISYVGMEDYLLASRTISEYQPK